MKFIQTKIDGVVSIEPKIFGDPRGFFLETYRKDLFAQNGIVCDFVQDNHSASSKGVLRGLHFQVPPKEQAKLVRVLRGEVFDVVVDMRRGSRTYGMWEGHTLNADNKKMLFVPAGVAHGFLATKDGTEFAYKVSDVYSPQHERGIRWDDPQLAICWPKLDTPYILSDRDKQLPAFQESHP